jgi:hypothetical protein
MSASTAIGPDRAARVLAAGMRDVAPRTAPPTAAAWTGDGASHEHRSIKHRPDHATRAVPDLPDLVTLLHRHLTR